jgi:hypothetical protein
MDAADAYFRWLCDAHERLDLTAEAIRTGPDKNAHCDLLDMDIMIARHCAASGLPEPIDLDERTHLHLQLLYEAIANREDGHAEETSGSDETIP